MRVTWLMLMAGAGLSAGCSLMIANSGKELDKVTTREQARAELGRLVECGEKDGTAYDLFRYHGKIPMCWGERMGMGMGWAMTYGMAEIVWLPRELFKLGRGLVVGQDVEVFYDHAGKVTEVRVGGKLWSYELFVHMDNESQPPLTSPPPQHAQAPAPSPD